MVKGTPLEGRMDDPSRDPHWLNDAQLARRQNIQRQMAAYEDSSYACGFQSYKIVDGDHEYRADQYVVWQHRTAFELLKRGVDVRAIAATIHRDVDWVENVARSLHS
jgi:Ni/Co efflux regulator RcnB